MPSALFIHRSVGRNLVHDGQIYQLIRETGHSFTFNDFDQNTGILQNESGRQKVSWRFPGNDTRPADYAELFSFERQQANDPTLAAILRYDILVIKSCYPNSNMASQQALEAAEHNYQSIISFFEAQPGKTLIILTSPPLTPLRTNAANAVRARKLADWLAHNQFANNVFVFDLFNELAAAPDQPQPNMLRREFRRWLPLDSHPNTQASKIIAPKLITFLVKVAVRNHL